MMKRIFAAVIAVILFVPVPVYAAGIAVVPAEAMDEPEREKSAGGTDITGTSEAEEDPGDTLAPQITLAAENGFDHWYREQTELCVTVTDDSHVAYVKVTADEEILREETLPEKNSDSKEEAEEGDIYEAKIPVSRSCGILKIRVIARDDSENEASVEQLLSLDGEAPVIIGTGIETGAMIGDVYDGVVTICEAYPDEDAIDGEVSWVDLQGNTYQMELNDWVEGTVENTMEQDVLLNREGNYSVRIDAGDRAGNTSTLEETFAIDLEAPVVLLFSELGEKYYDSFLVPYSVEEMTRDMSEVTVEYRLDGLRYDAAEEVTAPGLHLLKAVFTDAYDHKTEEEIRFVVRDPDEENESSGRMHGSGGGNGIVDAVWGGSARRPADLYGKQDRETISVQTDRNKQKEKPVLLNEIGSDRTEETDNLRYLPLILGGIGIAAGAAALMIFSLKQ